MSSVVNKPIQSIKFCVVLQHGWHQSTPSIKLTYGTHRNVECFHVAFDVAVTSLLYVSSVKLQEKYLNDIIDKSGGHCKCLCAHSMEEFCVDKVYGSNEIFEEISLVLPISFLLKTSNKRFET